MKILKPGGKFILTDAADNIVTTLKLNGFTDVKRGEDFITSQKPNFAVSFFLFSDFVIFDIQFIIKITLKKCRLVHR